MSSWSEAEVNEQDVTDMCSRLRLENQPTHDLAALFLYLDHVVILTMYNCHSEACGRDHVCVRV